MEAAKIAPKVETQPVDVVKQYAGKSLTVTVHTLFNYKRKEGVKVDVYLMYKRQLVSDRSKKPCRLEMQQPVRPARLQVALGLLAKFNLQINDLRQLDAKGLQHFVVLFALQSIGDSEERDDLGWLSFPVFNGQGGVNTGKFKIYLYKNPIIYETPIPTSKLVRLEEKTFLEFEVQAV